MELSLKIVFLVVAVNVYTEPILFYFVKKNAV
jgi:hypothetical protein